MNANAKKPKRKRIGRIPGMWKHPKTGRWYYSPMQNGTRTNTNLETTDPQLALERAVKLSAMPHAIGLPNQLEKEIADFLHAKAASNTHSRASEMQRPYVLGKFAKWARNIPIKQFGEEDAKDYYSHLQLQINPLTKRRLAETTIRSYIKSGVAPFFEWLVNERKVIRENPFKKLKLNPLKTEEVARDRVCSEQQRELILHHSLRIPASVLPTETAKWIAFVFHAGFECGLRKTEIIEARPDWFNLEGKTMTVCSTDSFTPKTRRARTIPLSATFLRFLSKYQMSGKWCIAPHGKLRATRPQGKKPRKRDIEAAIRRAAKPAKLREYRYDFERPFKLAVSYIGKQMGEDISWLTPHVMRHTFATLLAEGGVSLFKISKWLGDSPNTTEKHYTHIQAADPDIELSRRTQKPTIAVKKRQIRPSRKRSAR